MVIEKSFDEREILKIKHNNKNIYLGSKYNMNREVSKIEDAFLDTNKNYKIVIFGAAGGHWLKDYKEALKDRSVTIVEPLNELQKITQETISQFDLKIEVLSHEDKDFKDKLKNLMDKRFVHFQVFSNYDLVFANIAYELKSYINEIVIDKSIDENTRVLFSKAWFENYLSNLSSALNSENLNKYKNYFLKKPAIIVSAGPSLEKNIEFLKGNEDKFVIITGLRTLDALKKHGIRVDFTCAIDGGEYMYRVAKDALQYDTPMFFNEVTNKKVVSEYKGKKIYFSSPNFMELNKKLGGFGTDWVFQGGSVAHSCTALAHYMGCDPIVFVGQDLAFTNNQAHAKSATIRDEALKAEEPDLYVKDVYGDEVGTSYALDSFRKSFEDFIRSYNEIRYINATEGGANIEGTEVKRLIEVIDEFTNVIDKSCIISDEKNVFDVELTVNRLKENLKEIIKVKNVVKDGAKEYGNLLDSYFSNSSRYKNSLKRLDYIDEKVKNKQEEFLLVRSLFAPIAKEVDLAFYDESLGNFKNEVEHIKFVSDKGKLLYESIFECIEFAIPCIEQTIKSLEEVNDEQ